MQQAIVDLGGVGSTHPEGEGTWRVPTPIQGLAFRDARCGHPPQLLGRGAQAWEARGTDARGPTGTITTRERDTRVTPTSDTRRDRAAVTVTVPAPRILAATATVRAYSPSWKQLCESLGTCYSRPAKPLTSVSGAETPPLPHPPEVRPSGQEGKRAWEEQGVALGRGSHACCPWGSRAKGAARVCAGPGLA